MLTVFKKKRKENVDWCLNTDFKMVSYAYNYYHTDSKVDRHSSGLVIRNISAGFNNLPAIYRSICRFYFLICHRDVKAFEPSLRRYQLYWVEKLCFFTALHLIYLGVLFGVPWQRAWKRFFRLLLLPIFGSICSIAYKFFFCHFLVSVDNQKHFDSIGKRKI